MPVEIPLDKALELKMRFCCPNCGSEDLKYQAWVNPDGDLIRHTTNESGWCNPCETYIEPKPFL